MGGNLTNNNLHVNASSKNRTIAKKKVYSNIISHKRTFSSTRTLNTRSPIVDIAKGTIPYPEGAEALLIRSSTSTLRDVASELPTFQNDAYVIVLGILVSLCIYKIRPYILEYIETFKTRAFQGKPNLEGMSPGEIDACLEFEKRITGELQTAILHSFDRIRQIENYVRFIVDKDMRYFYECIKTETDYHHKLTMVQITLVDFQKAFGDLMSNENAIEYLT